jgi:hypothetical protein
MRSNDFDRFTPIVVPRRTLEFGAGLRLQARAADSRRHTINIEWRGSQGRPGGRPALEGQTR